MTDKEEDILMVLGEADTSWLKPVDIAKRLGLQTAKDVNKHLYSLQKKGLIGKRETSPPLWSITGEGRLRMNGEKQKMPSPVAAVNPVEKEPSVTKFMWDSKNGDSSRSRHSSGDSLGLGPSTNVDTRSRHGSGDSKFPRQVSSESSSGNRAIQQLPLDSIDFKVLETSSGQIKSTQLAKLMGKSKKELNPILYKLENQKMLKKVNETPPEWERTSYGTEVLELSRSQSCSESSSHTNASTYSMAHKGSRLQREFSEIEILGKGGFASVKKARHNIDNKMYAVKEVKNCTLSHSGNCLMPSEQVVREVRLLSALNHPGIVRYFFSWVETIGETGDISSSEETSSYEITSETTESNVNNADIQFEAGTTTGNLYIQMELCEPLTLKDKINENMSDSKASNFFNEILDGLAYIHGEKVIHRDLKPANIFIDKEDHIKIGDFGLAAIQRSQSLPNKSSDSEHESVGTPTYAAPEIYAKSYCEKVDVYSLGIILFEMSYRPMEFGMERQTVISMLKKSKVELPKDYCGTEGEMIKRLLEHDPAKRPSSQELHEERNLKHQLALP